MSKLRRYWWVVILLLLSLVLIGCDEDTVSIQDNTMTVNKVWTDGVFYNSKGPELYIQSKIYYSIELDKQNQIYDTVWYQNESHRVWEHKYTAGGMNEDIYYWDDKSNSWYTFNRSGDYYVYKWVSKRVRVNNYAKN